MPASAKEADHNPNIVYKMVKTHIYTEPKSQDKKCITESPGIICYRVRASFFELDHKN
jgi:hypothetical protein